MTGDGEVVAMAAVRALSEGARLELVWLPAPGCGPGTAGLAAHTSHRGVQGA